MGSLNALREFSQRCFCVRRNVRAHRLLDQEQIERCVEVVEKIDDPSTPRLPVPALPHRTLRIPPVSLMTSPASGFLAMKSMKASCSSSLQTSSACRKKLCVPATVMGLVHISAVYAIGAHYSRSLPECPTGPKFAMEDLRLSTARLPIGSPCPRPSFSRAPKNSAPQNFMN